MTNEKKLSELCVQWADTVRYQVKPSTYGVYTTMIEKHILPELGAHLVAKLSNEVLDRFLQEKQDQDLSWNTMRLIMFLLKGIIQMGEDMGIEPGERLRYHIPRYKRSSTKMFEQEDSARLLRYLEESDDVFELGLLISICTGIRVGELCGLQWKDVNWTSGTLQINRTVSRIRNPEMSRGVCRPLKSDREESLPRTIVYIGTPKTGTSIREIPLPDFLILKMLRYKRDGACYIISGTVRCMEPRGVQRRFKNLLRRRSIPEINIHALRHAFASRWIENGFDSKALSEILGHSSVKITMDIYVHSNMEQKKSYMNRMV